MAVTNPLVTINGVTLSTSEIKSYKLSYAKLWKDAGRDMSGKLSATLIGVYPNIDLTTALLSFSKAMQLSAAVNVDYFTVTYWDTQTSTQKSATYYSADHDVTLSNECIYGEVQIQLVPVSKASYI
jgi:hypothetical protein